MERKPVEMIRLEQPAEVYDVEAVLGRDAASVFPTMRTQLDPMEQLRATMGAKRFVTETELEEIKAARGLSVDDGTASADKPLAEVLAERKKAKQDAFEEQWRQMKTGKNRPLDDDELEFFDGLAEHEATAQRQLAAQEAAELDAYRAAVAAAAAASAPSAQEAAAVAGSSRRDATEPGDEIVGQWGSSGSASSAPAPLPRAGSGTEVAGPTARVAAASKQSIPVLRPVVKVKPKGCSSGAGTGGIAPLLAGAQQQQQQQASAAQGLPDSKRQRLDEQQQQVEAGESAAGVGLAGLLGDYGSASESEEGR